MELNLMHIDNYSLDFYLILQILCTAAVILSTIFFSFFSLNFLAVQNIRERENNTVTYNRMFVNMDYYIISSIDRSRIYFSHRKWSPTLGSIVRIAEIFS